MIRIGREDCPYCHRSSEIYISNPRSIWEDLLVLLLLRPVRCHDCMQRFYRPLFISTPIAASPGTNRKTTRPTDSAKKDEQKLA